MGRYVLALCLVGGALEAGAATVTKGYSTQLELDGAPEPGADRTLAGSGAPLGPGVHVELWRVAPAAAAAAESVASVRAIDGAFRFDGVDVEEGESYYVTLSRSWNFNTDGDAEGWDRLTTNVRIDVSGGTLKARITGVDPHFFNFFEYDSNLYRVVEVRIRNPAPAVFPEPPPPRQNMSILWGDFSDAGRPPTFVNLHAAEIPSESQSFETIMIPLNAGELKVVPPPVEFDQDGLWASGLRESLRIDPLDPGSPSAIGLDFEIDFIRIREDFRLEFHSAGDPSGIGRFHDVADVSISGGFLSCSVLDGPSVDPFLLFGFETGRIESGYFSRFVIGMDNPLIEPRQGSLGVLFDDDNSSGYIDAITGSLQVSEIASSFVGRRDLVMVLDDQTTPIGEWTADGRVPVKGLQVNFAAAVSPGDRIRIDYLGFIPENPYGPSDPVVARFPNLPPVAVIVSDPDPAEVFLENGAARIVLDGGQSDDGDGGTQELSYWWDVVSGPAAVIIDRPDEPLVEAILCGAGEFVLRLTVSDGELSDAADIVVLVRSESERILRERIERRIERLEEGIDRIEAKIRRLEGEIAQLKAKVDALKAELPVLAGRKARKAERTIAGLEDAIGRKMECIEKKKQMIERKEEKIAALEDRLRAL